MSHRSTLLRALLLACALAGAVAPHPAIATAAEVALDPETEADALFRVRDWKAAEAAYARITKSQPKNGRAWMRLGIARQQQQKYPGAAAAYHRVFAMDGPAASTAAYNLATVHALQKQPKQAFAWLDKAARKGFADLAQLDADPDLATLRQDERFAAVCARVDANAHPCKVSKPARQLDFWLGAWDVFDPSGQQVGTSKIELRADGCVVFESWTSARGSNGNSMSFYDAQTKHWHQVWVDAQGGVLRFEGQLEGTSMRYAAESRRPDGTPQLERLGFTPLDGGRVRQLWEQSADGGKTWTVAFDGLYVPKK